MSIGDQTRKFHSKRNKLRLMKDLKELTKIQGLRCIQMKNNLSEEMGKLKTLIQQSANFPIDIGMKDQFYIKSKKFPMKRIELWRVLDMIRNDKTLVIEDLT